MNRFDSAKEIYSALGIDAEEALELYNKAFLKANTKKNQKH